jgi:hypothetical protein
MGHGWPAFAKPAKAGAVAVGTALVPSNGPNIITPADRFLFTSRVQELPPALPQVTLTPSGELMPMPRPAQLRHYAKYKIS